MRPSIHKTLLVIADISGFTQFMKSHENTANHAMQVVVELLRAVISAAAPPLKLAEVEGDAAFFYAICKEDGDITRELAAIKRHKLFGMDVILAHRLLKNSVPSPEYVLMTESAYNWLGDFHQLEPERQTEYCEGIGAVETVVIYLPAQLIHVDKKLTAKFHSNTSPFLPNADFLDTARGRFGTSLNDYLLSEPFHPSTRAQPVRAELVEAELVEARLAQFQTNIKWRQRHEVYVTDLL